MAVPERRSKRSFTLAVPPDWQYTRADKGEESPVGERQPSIPEWLQEEAERTELSKIQGELRAARDAAAQSLIAVKGPLFVERVLARLGASVNALQQIGMAGSINSVGDGAFRICVNKLGPYANYTHTDLFFEPLRIRCHFLEGGGEEFRYCALSERELAVIDGADPMKEEEVADSIMRRMVHLVKTRM